MNDSFLKTLYAFSQIVKVATGGQAILDKIWTNMNMVYSKPVTVAELGTSDHNMVLLKPSSKRTLDTGNITRMSVKSMGAKEKVTFELALSLIKWEPLYRLDSWNEKCVYYQTVIEKLIEICFPSKVVTRHTGDKPWITDGYRLLIRKRQRAHMRGDIVEARSLRNQVKRATATLKFDFYHTRIEAMHESGTQHWWKNLKKLMGQKTTDKSNVQSLASKTTDGNVKLLASKMNDFFVSVSEHLPRLDRNNEAFDVDDQLPDEYVIALTTTLQALRKVKTNKATVPDNVPDWILKNHANILAGPLTEIFNSSLREGVIPETWKYANVIPLPKLNSPNTKIIEKDIRPISLTPIVSITLESIILNMVNEKIE